MKKALVFLILLLLLPTHPVLASMVEEEQIELQMRDIAKTLRCTICQNESIWESQAGLAQQMREIIRERLRQGETPDQVRAYFHSRYGDYILLAPRKQGLNWLLWGGPFVLLAIGGLFLYHTLSRWVSQASQAGPQETPVIDDRLRSRIDQELKSRHEEGP
ncbi:MAG TPA: cytochrome c-type biogenesis protein [Nitrospiria bacterium]